MAWQDSKEEDSTSKLFNERINKEQEELNKCWKNPTAFNIEYDCYNYEIIFASINNLLIEIDALCDPDEKEKAHSIRIALDNFITKYPIHETYQDEASGKTKIMLNKEKWNVLKKYLFQYQLLVKNYMKIHLSMEELYGEGVDDANIIDDDTFKEIRKDEEE